MRKILVLNRDFIPIRFCSKFNAIGKMYVGAAEPILFDENNNYEAVSWDKWLELSSSKGLWPTDQEFINSPSISVAIPQVIKCTKYAKIPKATIRLNRTNIYARDKQTCYICGEKFSESKLSIDHIVPISRGGRNEWTNLISCCKKCNAAKGDKLLSELGIKPKFAAYKPTTSNIAKLKAGIGNYDPIWALFGL